MFCEDSEITQEDIKNLIKKLESINIEIGNSDISNNFFEICKYPYYENVISNVLQYFFSKYGNLFLNSLMKEKYENEKIESVEREVITEDKKRLDIVIITNKRILGIENKIYANDNWQPYKSYNEFLSEKAKELNIEKKLILLSIFQEKASNEEVEPIKYSEFFSMIKQNIGNYVMNFDNEDIILLKHFINNIENIMGNNFEEKYEGQKEKIQTLLEHNEILYKSFNKILEYKRDVIKEFKKKIIKNEGNNIRIEKKSWDKGMTQPIECLESNLSLGDFSKYGNVVISLWIYNDKIEIALALLKYELNKDFNIKEDKLAEKDNKDWYILFKETHNFKNGIINIDECVKEAENLIKEFKEKQNTFFILKQ